MGAMFGNLGIDINMVVFMGVAIVILLLVAFMYIKDKEVAKKTRLYERSIEDLNQQIFRLQKRVKEIEIERDLPGNNIEELVKKEIRNQITTTAINNQNSVNELEKTIYDIREELGEQIAILEERVKEMSYIPSSVDGADDKKVISMYENGWSVDAIAKELRAPKESILLTLRLARII